MRSYIFCQISLIAGLFSAKEMHEMHSYSERLSSVNLPASHASNCISFNVVLEAKINPYPANVENMVSS